MTTEKSLELLVAAGRNLLEITELLNDKINALNKRIGILEQKQKRDK
jgi:hypothetical protein